MGSLSNYSENKILDHILKVASFTAPSYVYMALSTADPTEDGSGIAEPSGFGYVRVSVPYWSAASARATQNVELITFPEARGSWGIITHFALYDAIITGNMLAYGALTDPITVGNSDSISFGAGMVDIVAPAAGLSNAYANKILDHLFMVTSLSVPGNIFVALATAAILDSDDGDTISEPADGYARLAHNVWDAAASGASENTGEITFAASSGDWDETPYFALLDAGTSGDVILHGTLDAAITVSSGDVAHWNAGALDITLT